MNDTDGADERPERRGIQSVELGIRLLEALAWASGPMPLKALSQAAGMPASQAHRYVSSYMRGGLVVQDAESGRYDLGPLALRLGLAALGRLDLIRLARQAMRDLTTDTHVTSVMVVWGPSGPVVTGWERGAPPLIANFTIGSLFPVLSSASGRVLVSYTPETVTAAIVGAELARAAGRGGDGPGSMEAVRAMAAGIRARGCDSAMGSVIPGLWALSAPVLDCQGEAVAVITLARSDMPSAEDGAVLEDKLLTACHSLFLRAGGTAQRSVGA